MASVDAVTVRQTSANAARLEGATHATPETIAISHGLIICFAVICFFFALLSSPYTVFRMRHFGLWRGWSLSSRRSPKPLPHEPVGFQGPPIRLPRRIGRLPIPLPSYIIPKVSLSIPQAALLLLATLVVLVASFVHSHWLSDASRTGYISITLVPCVILLGIKGLGVGTVLQVGYASVNWAHRWLGRLLFLIATIHAIAYYIVFAQARSMGTEMAKFENIMATISYAGLCVIFFASVGIVRKRWWRWFKMCHHFGIALFVVGLNYHSRQLRPWIIFSVLFVAIGILARTTTTRLAIGYVTPLDSSKSTVIVLPSIRTGWIPGQSVRIRILTGGMGFGHMWESHPFTLASAPSVHNDEGAKLVVKAAGDWTKRLFEMAKTKGDSIPIDLEKSSSVKYPVAVLIEGPYGGSNLVYSGFGAVLLAAGGSGVSFVLGVASGIIADCRAGRSCTRDINLVWTVRDRAAVNDLKPHFEALLESARFARDLQLTITLYFTSATRGLIVRPFSLIPTGGLLSSAGIGNTPHSRFIPGSRASDAPQAKIVKGNLGMSLGFDTTSSTAQLLAPGNSSVVSLSGDSRFNIVDGRGDAEGATDSDKRSQSSGCSTGAYRSTMEEASQDGNVHFSLSRSPSSASTSSSATAYSNATLATNGTIDIRPGRPDYCAILQDVIERELARSRRLERTSQNKAPKKEQSTSVAGAGRIAVGACGPSGMVAGLRQLCWDAEGVEFHAEEFSL